MSINKSVEILKIADIHAQHIMHVMKKLQPWFPLSTQKVANLLIEELVCLDFLVNRCAKLQDYMGAKVIDLFLESQCEAVKGLSMLDKLHKLEQLEILEDAEIWVTMRDLRHHLTHEYPDHPEMTAKYLNEVFGIAPQLLLLLNNLKARL